MYRLIGVNSNLSGHSNHPETQDRIFIAYY
jgi:hypothetical protein